MKIKSSLQVNVGQRLEVVDQACLEYLNKCGIGVSRMCCGCKTDMFGVKLQTSVSACRYHSGNITVPIHKERTRRSSARC